MKQILNDKHEVKWSENRSVVSYSLQPHGMEPARFLCPWDSPGKSTGVGCHALLQGIFPTQGSNLYLLCILYRQAGSLPLAQTGNPGREEIHLSCCCSVPQSCPIFCDPMDYGPPDSSVHKIILARILEWVAISLCKGSSQPRDQTCVSCGSCIDRQIFYHLSHPGNPKLFY